MILRENMDLSMRHVRRSQESGSLGPTVRVSSGHKERRVNDEKNPGLGQSRSYNSVNLQQNALHIITSRRRRDADSRAPLSRRCLVKQPFPLCPFPSLRIGPLNAMVMLCRQSTQFRLSRLNNRCFCSGRRERATVSSTTAAAVL
jgi:hypothetical protein